MDAHRAGCPHQDVLVVIGHPDDLMRHHLANREHQVEAALGDHAVHLRRPGVVKQAVRLLLDKGCRQLAQCDHIRTPVVDREERVRDVAEHPGKRRRRHCRMRSQRGQNAGQTDRHSTHRRIGSAGRPENRSGCHRGAQPGLSFWAPAGPGPGKARREGTGGKASASLLPCWKYMLIDGMPCAPGHTPTHALPRSLLLRRVDVLPPVSPGRRSPRGERHRGARVWRERRGCRR